MSDDGRSGDDDEVVTIEITDELDLHTFAPSECADLVDEYLHEARARGFERVRIVHGKGHGVLRRIVHAVLDRHEAVASYRLGDEHSGSWGATLVELAPPEPPDRAA